MKRSILGMAVLILSAGLARAEATGPANSPLAAAGQQYAEAFNRKDVAAVAALFTEDAVRVTDRGMVHGRAAIQKDMESAIKAGAHSLSIRYQAAQIDGNTAWSIAEYQLLRRAKDGTDAPVHGFGTTAWVRDGDTWKIRAQGLTNAPPSK